jgi:NADH-quinone oxidoreductase subunit J
MNLTFIILSSLLISSALAVVLLRNPIHSALALVVNLIGVAVVFAALDAHFLAMVQIIVYGGAIMVLVVFVLMLINTKLEERNAGTWFQIVLAGSAASCLAVVMLGALRQGLSSVTNSTDFSSAAEAVPKLEGTVQLLGQKLYTSYLLPFEASAILLMAAMVAAAMLAKTEKEDEDK